MATKKKVLTEEGVRRLWAAIEAKFIDVDESEFFDNYEAMTTADIDAITGYEEPAEDPEDPNGGEG